MSARDSAVWQLPGLWFSSDELHALLTMDRLLGDSGLPTVTLVTCYPFYFVGNAPQRFVVTGEYLWNDHT